MEKLSQGCPSPLKKFGCTARGILALRSGIKLEPPELEGSLNRWTTGKVPRAALQEVSAFSLTASPPTWMKTASSTVEPHFALFWSSNLLLTQQPDFQTELFQVNQRQSHSSAQKPPVTSYCSWGGGTFRGKKANFSMVLGSPTPLGICLHP